MEFALWSAIIGVLLVTMALSDSVLARVPLSTSMLYLGVGVALSPAGLGLSTIALLPNARLLEHLAEVVVLLSLFTSGLKLSVGLSDGRWLLPLRLAVTSMAITIALVAALGTLIGLPLGAAILLGAILAPTDPVLASEVQTTRPTDRDRLRFALTGEAGLNDGSAFPFVMLGLGLIGLHDLGATGLRWVAVDVVWATLFGLAVGALLGTAVGKLVLYLRRTHQEAVGLDSFLALGLVAGAYGAAQLGHGYGFLAVFAAGVALRRIERRETALASGPPESAAADARVDPELSRASQLAVDPQHAPAFMAHAVLSFNEEIERIGEVAAVLVIGMSLWAVDWSRVPWWFVPGLLVLIRPASVAVGLAFSRTSWSQRALIGWFGIRGIGSLYYLMYAVNHGLDPELANTLVALTLACIVGSIVAHGISVTPLVAMYERTKARARPPPRG